MPSPKLKLYNPRHPERTLLYQTVAEHYETWLDLASAGQFDGLGDYRTPKPYVRMAFAKYLQCGIFAQGFARARCDDCGHDYFVAFSCKGRGVCPSCTARRIAETAAHLCDHMFPRQPVRPIQTSLRCTLARRPSSTVLAPASTSMCTSTFVCWTGCLSM